MQFSELRNETQQLLVGDLDGCISWESWATCHTSDTGAACECETTDDSDRWESCRAQNCSRNCSPAVHVSCYKSFEPSANSGALPRLYNETLSALVVNGTKATFDPSELQVVEEHPIEFDCNQLVEVVIGVEYNFEMLCPLFKESFNSNFVWENPSMLAHGLLWRQECFDLGVEETRRCFVCLVALEAALGNSSDAWVNLTQNYSTTAIAYNYYDKTRPSWYSDKWSSPHTGDIYIRTPVGLSIHIARQKPASEMWSPEAISVPCLVEQKAFELVVKFTGGMSDLRGDSYPETASLLYSSSGTVRTVGGSAAGSLLARFHTGPVSRVLWSRPGRQRYEMPEEELEAWRSRRNQSGKPSDRHIIRSIASNSSSLRLTLVPPAGGRDTAWSFCFFPADGNHIYKEVCAGKFPVRQSQAECRALHVSGNRVCVGSMVFPVLIDEADKADSDFLQLLLEVIEEASLSLTGPGAGRVDFRHTVVLLTSNDPAGPDALPRALADRLDGSEQLRPLNASVVKEVLDGLVEDFSLRLVQSHPHAELQVTEAWRKTVLDKLSSGEDSGLGARVLRRALRQFLEDPIAFSILEHQVLVDVNEGQAAAAREHLAKAEQALKPSWTSFKFSPDHLMASMEYSQAATQFRAAGLLQECADAWVKSGQMKELLHDLFGAGRAYESAAGICDGTGPGGPATAMLHWEQAVRCFRVAGKADVAAKLLLKIAGVREKQGDVDGAKSAYEETINVFEQEEKDYELGDVYKTYIGFLIRRDALEDALKAMDGHISVLQRQKSLPFAHKELLSKIVLLMKLEDCVRAEEILTSTNMDGWIMSREYQVGTELVEAIKNYDAEALAGLQKEQIFTFLQVEVARIAKLLKVAAMTKPLDGGYPGDKPEPPDIADLIQ